MADPNRSNEAFQFQSQRLACGMRDLYRSGQVEIYESPSSLCGWEGG